MNIWYEFLAALIRWALAAVFGGLVVHGIISAELSHKLLTGIDGQLGMIVVGVLVPVLWSFWNKIKAKVKIITALELPPSASQQQLKRAVDSTPAPEKVKLATEARR